MAKRAVPGGSVRSTQFLASARHGVLGLKVRSDGRHQHEKEIKWIYISYESKLIFSVS
jgi:hypothetical protein